LAAEVAPGGSLRAWYHNLTNTTVFNKDIQNEVTEGEIMKGSFLTYYRFEKFGATNPEEIDTTAPMVAFTFDDGPNPEYTQRILDVLTANYSHATFFVVGNNAEDYPEVLQSISSAGCEIGNHTYGHKVNRAVIKATGESTTVIRPPYGSYNDDVLNVMQEPVVLWDLDTEDWSSRNAQKVTEKVLENIKDGDIVLMHDIYDSTAEAVEILVPKLKEQGYQIVSVSELARYKGKTLELNKAYGEIEGSEE
jgi:peptidoglycan/xylan/chitin deacetylase (PgdA/CDA1 family)